jgi:hypothetical protein
VKALWAMVQGDPVFMRRVNGWLAVFWVAMIPFSLAMGWLSSVYYVSALSLWALVSGHWSAWQAARVEVAQQEDAKKKLEEDVPGQVVDAMLARTTVEENARSGNDKAYFLEQLTSLKGVGLLTDEEFETKRDQLNEASSAPSVS